MKHQLKHKNKTVPQEYKLLAVLWGLPLVCIPNSQMMSVVARWSVLVGFAIIMLTTSHLRTVAVREFRSLTILQKVLMSVLTVTIVGSTFASSESWAVRLGGWSGENLGLFAWLSFIIVALTVRSQVRAFLASQLCLIISGLVCVGSLLIDTRLITHGFRVSGLLIVATSTAIYAALTLGIALWHLLFTKKHHVTAGLVTAVSATTLVLCQSRVAQFVAVVVCMFYAIYIGRQKKLLALAPLAVLVLLVVVPLFGGAYFSRMRSEQVASGLAYRGAVYRLSAREAVQEHQFFGLGPSGVPQYINSRKNAPPGIVESLNQKYVFLSAHDVFLDAALCFGLLGGLALLGLVLWASHTLLKERLTQQLLLVGGIFFALLANALLNVPSIELTSLLIITAVAILPSQIVVKKTSKNS